MALSFFNLKCNPFASSPTPDRLFLSRSHLRGRQDIAYSIEGRKGLVALLAPRGVGKTTLVQAYLAQRQQRNIRTLWLPGASSTFAAILDRLCAQYHVPAHGRVEATLRALRAAMMREAEAGYRAVLIIDEAETLPTGALEELLVLTEMENNSGKLLTVILMGEPALEQHLKRAYAQTFRSEKYRRIRLDPLQQPESMAYVRHCIARSSTDANALFTPGALRGVVRYARGNIGLLNYVCNEVLRAALIAQKKPITQSIVRAVLNDLEGRQSHARWRWSLAALVGVLALAGMSMGAPRMGQLWPQPHLVSMVTELVDKVKALPSMVTQEDTPRGSESPLPVEVEIETQPVPVLARGPVEPATRTAPVPPKPLQSPVTPEPPPAPERIPAPEPNFIAQASLLCLTARTPGHRARDIILVNHRGQVQQRLVSDGALNLSPTLSPDQDRLAYTSYRSGEPSIYLRDLRHAKEERLTSRTGMALPSAWSPDGRYLALSMSKDGNSDIFLYDLQRRHMRRLTRDPSIDISPSFAPDGKRLVFTSNRSGVSQLYLTDIDGLTPQRLTREGDYNAAPAWSPQGSWIAFIGRAPDRTLELYVIRDDGTALQRVTTAGGLLEEAPTWSPDGRSILYTRLHNGTRQRRIVTRDGGHDQEWPGHGQVCYAPQWVAQSTH